MKRWLRGALRKNCLTHPHKKRGATTKSRATKNLYQKEALTQQFAKDYEMDTTRTSAANQHAAAKIKLIEVYPILTAHWPDFLEVAHNE